MIATMSKRPRMIFDTTDALRLAIEVRASKHRVSTSSIIVACCMGETYITAEELKEAEKLLAEQEKGFEPPPHPKRPKR
jgi:hypothetical protein